jgi:hypothetical protein
MGYVAQEGNKNGDWGNEKVSGVVSTVEELH